MSLGLARVTGRWRTARYGVCIRSCRQAGAHSDLICTPGLVNRCGLPTAQSGYRLLSGARRTAAVTEGATRAFC
jgi:hypothetical protein